MYAVSLARPSVPESGTLSHVLYAESSCVVRLCRYWKPVCVLPAGAVQPRTISPGFVPVAAVKPVGGDCGCALAAGCGNRSEGVCGGVCAQLEVVVLAAGEPGHRIGCLVVQVCVRVAAVRDIHP